MVSHPKHVSVIQYEFETHDVVSETKDCINIVKV